MFRRRRTDSGQPGNEPEGTDSGLGEPEPGPDDDGPGEPEPGAGEASPETAGTAGPWDAGDDVPRQERIDFGSLLVPSREGMEIQVSVVENQPAWITVMHGKSGLQLQAFAAPKSGGLWDEIRQEIAAEVARSGGQSAEADGPFGVELRARITPPTPSTAAGVARWSRSASWGWTGPAGSCAASSAARRPFMRTRPGPWSRYSQPSSWSAVITRSRPVTCWRSGFPTRRCKSSARSRQRPGRRASGR